MCVCVCVCVHVCVCVYVCNCVRKVNFTVPSTHKGRNTHISIVVILVVSLLAINIYMFLAKHIINRDMAIMKKLHRDVCEKYKESLRILKALSLKMINLTYILIYEHVFAWYCVENICILYQKLKFPNLLMVHRLPSFLCILFIHALYGPP